MPDYYEWVGVDASGKSTTYQCTAPAAESEASVLEEVRKAYKNVRVISLRRITMAELKPATGTVRRETYNHGIINEVERLLGKQAPAASRSLFRVVQGQREQRQADVRDGMDEFNELLKPIEGAVRQSLLSGSRLRHTQSLLRRISPTS